MERLKKIRGEKMIAEILVFFLAALIPGVPFSLALLRKLNRPLPEIILFGFILGLILPTSLTLIFTLFGVPFTPTLSFACIGIVTAAGVILMLQTGAHKDLKFDLKAEWQWVVLGLIMLAAFWIRSQSMTAIFYEFDPYYYQFGTRQLLTQGIIPPTDDYAYPLYSTLSHRNEPMINYLPAEWVSIYSQMTNTPVTDTNTIALVAGLYPVVVGALLCFLFYEMITAFYRKEFGLVAAGFAAVMPILIEKFAWGESEVTPWGIFAALFFYAAYIQAIKLKSRRFALLAAIALFAAEIGSKSSVMIYLPVASFIGIWATLEFFRKTKVINFIKTNTDFRSFLEINAISLAGAIPAFILMAWYGHGTISFLSIPVEWIATVMVLIYAIGLYLLVNAGHLDNQRKNYTLLAIIIALLAFAYLTPIGSHFYDYVSTAAGLAVPSNVVAQTVAEETPTAGNFASALGILSNPELILLVAFVLFAYVLYLKDDTILLFMLLIFPIAYIGLNKMKYLEYLTIVIIPAFVIIFAEAYELLAKAYEKYRTYILYMALLVPVYLVLSQSLDIMNSLGGFPAVLTTNVCSTNQNTWLYNYLCQSRIPNYWLEPMAWIKSNVASNDYVLSWWDYGHWTNWFGERKTVTRNDHPYPEMDPQVADKFVAGTPQDLKDFMVLQKSKYVLFDQDLIGKWGALVYLSCIYNNETNYSVGPGGSQCDKNHYFETIYVPHNPTSINDYCTESDQPMLKTYGGTQSYCFTQATINDQTLNVLILGNQTVPTFLAYAGSVTNNGLQYDSYMLIYIQNPGYNISLAYSSTFYQGFFLGNLPGFVQVYPTTSGPASVKIYKIAE